MTTESNLVIYYPKCKHVKLKVTPTLTQKQVHYDSSKVYLGTSGD